MRHDKKPYQARPLLKSIRYWQSVVNGVLPPKRPLAYYVNQLKWYTQDDIDYLEQVSKAKMVKRKNKFEIEHPQSEIQS